MPRNGPSRSLQETIAEEIRRANDPLSRISMREMIDFSRHWTAGHEQMNCDQCIRFATVLFLAGGLVIDPDTGEGTLHPQLLELAEAGRRADAVDPPQHTDHIHVTMGASTNWQAAASPPPGDVLDTVAEDGSLRCACGCRARITDDSPSAYYASAGCQAKVMQGYATNPQEVYSGVDAHHLLQEEILAAQVEHRAAAISAGWTSVFTAAVETAEPSTADRLDSTWQPVGWTPAPVGWTPAPVDPSPALDWLMGLRNVWVAGRAPEELAELEVTDGMVQVVVPPAPYESLMDYRRHCAACGARTRPYTVAGPVRAGDRISAAEINPGLRARLVRQECAQCRYRLTGRVCFGAAQPHPTTPGVWRLTLQDGMFEVSRDVPTSELPHQQACADAADAAWRRLEERLDRFAGAWRPAEPEPGATPDPAGRSPFLIDVPPPPRRRGRT